MVKVIIDRSPTGTGKTHGVGLYEGKSDYISNDYKNPPAPTIESFWPIYGRHSENYYKDDSGKLTTEPVRFFSYRTSSCAHSSAINKAQAKNRSPYDGSESFCKKCPSFGTCISTNKYEGSGHLHDRAIGLAKDKRRFSPLSMPNVENGDYGDRVGFLEEADQTLRAALKIIEGGASDLADAYLLVDEKSPDLAQKIKPAITALRAIAKEKHGYHGLAKEEILTRLQPIDGLDEVIHQLEGIFQLDPFQWEEADRVNGMGGAGKLVNRQFAIEAKERNDERIEAAFTDILTPILKILGGENGGLSFNQGKFTATLKDRRLINIYKSYSTLVLLSATVDPAMVAGILEIKLEDIQVISRSDARFENLTIYQTNIKGIRSNSLRSDNALDRVKKYVDHARRKEPGVKVLSLKKDREFLEADGHWLHDSRGSNDLEREPKILTVSLPWVNVGAVKAEYDAFGFSESFEQYYSKIFFSEIVQLIGRQRCQRYPDLQFELDLLATFDHADENLAIDLSFLSDEFGCTVIKRNASEVCPEAGNSKEKMVHALKTAIEGIKYEFQISQKWLAEALNTSQGNISKLIQALGSNWLELKKKIFQNLKDSYNKMEYFEKEPQKETESGAGQWLQYLLTVADTVSIDQAISTIEKLPEETRELIQTWLILQADPPSSLA